MSHMHPNHVTARDFSFCFLSLFFLIGLSMVGCTRSLWVKSDGHEVSPNEQLECSLHVQETNNGQDYVDQETLKQQIEQCM